MPCICHMRVGANTSTFLLFGNDDDTKMSNILGIKQQEHKWSIGAASYGFLKVFQNAIIQSSFLLFQHDI